MAEDEDLELLGSVGATTSATADEETDEGSGDEVEERPHRPIVPGLSERESGFSTPTGHRCDPQRVPTTVHDEEINRQLTVRSRVGNETECSTQPEYPQKATGTLRPALR